MFKIVKMDDSFINELGSIDKKIIDTTLHSVSIAVKNYWKSLVMKKGGSLAKDYLYGHSNADEGDGLNSPVTKEGVSIISLVGDWPVAIEQGCAPWDLRDTILNSANSHVGKDGYRYMNVPFRHRAGNRGAGFGNPYARDTANPQHTQEAAASIGKTVFKEAKKLDPYKRGTSSRLAEGLAPKLKDVHKTDIFQGMVRLEKKYDKRTESQYMTFRRISENPKTSDGNWIHPGLSGIHVLPEVEREAQKILFTAFEALLGEIISKK